MSETPSSGASIREIIANRWNPSKEEMAAAKEDVLKLCNESGVNLQMLFAIRSAFMHGNINKKPIAVYSHLLEPHLRKAECCDILRTFKTTPVKLTIQNVLVFETSRTVTIAECLTNALFVRVPYVGLAAELYRVLLDRPLATEYYDKLVGDALENTIFAHTAQNEEEARLQEDWRSATVDMRYEQIAKICIEYRQVFRLSYGRVSIIDPEQKYTVFLPTE